MFVVLEDNQYVRKLVSGLDLLESDRPERFVAKNQLHYLLRRQLVTKLSPMVLESIAQIDGSVVLDRDSNLLAFGTILRHRLPLDQDEEVGEIARAHAPLGFCARSKYLVPGARPDAKKDRDRLALAIFTD
jgi:hypothetical protein